MYDVISFKTFGSVNHHPPLQAPFHPSFPMKLTSNLSGLLKKYLGKGLSQSLPLTFSSLELLDHEPRSCRLRDLLKFYDISPGPQITLDYFLFLYFHFSRTDVMLRSDDIPFRFTRCSRQTSSVADQYLDGFSFLFSLVVPDSIYCSIVRKSQCLLYIYFLSSRCYT